MGPEPDLEENESDNCLSNNGNDKHVTPGGITVRDLDIDLDESDDDMGMNVDVDGYYE